MEKSKFLVTEEKGICGRMSQQPGQPGTLLPLNQNYIVYHREDTALKHLNTEKHGVMDNRQRLEYGSNLKNPFHLTRLHQDNKDMWLCYYIRMRTD